MSSLRTAAQQALEVLLKSHTCPLLPDDCDESITALRAALAQEQAEPVQEQVELEKYNELLMAVSKKHPNETRHETALRYILKAEQHSYAEQNALSDKLTEVRNLLSDTVDKYQKLSNDKIEDKLSRHGISIPKE